MTGITFFGFVKNGAKANSTNLDFIHRYLHVHLACIPPPNGRIVKEVIEQLQMLEYYGAISLDDPIEKRLKVLIAFFDCVEQPTADALKEQLRLVYEFKKSPSL